MTGSANLIFYGCGNMGAALASGYMAGNPCSGVYAVDPQLDRARTLLGQHSKASVVASLAAIGEPAEATILALKPQVTLEALPELAGHQAGQGLIISVVAGISTGVLKAALPNARIIRAMPNTPALIGKGTTGLFAAPETTANDKRLCNELFSAVGRAFWVNEERDIDRITAVSGSGPAYVFAFAEALVSAGTKIGLTPDLALALASGTIAGAAGMIEAGGSPLAEMKSAVRSPAGTTDAALKVFENEDALVRLVEEAVRAAERRAVELGYS